MIQTILFPVEYLVIIYIYVNTFIKISLFYLKTSTATAEKSDIRKQYPIRQKFSTISTFSQFRKSRGREPREPNNYLSLVHEREKSKFSLAGQDQKQNGELIHSNVTPFTTSILFETSHKIIILILFSSVLQIQKIPRMMTRQQCFHVNLQHQIQILIVQIKINLIHLGHSDHNLQTDLLYAAVCTCILRALITLIRVICV